MKGFDRFEGFAERLIESPFRRLLGGALQPVDIARRLARVMDDHQTISAGKVFVPNRYQVFLHPETLAGFASYQRALEEELADFLVETAQGREVTFVGRPHVSLLPDPGVRREDLRVEAQLADSAELGRLLEHTQDLPVQEIRQALEEAVDETSARAPGGKTSARTGKRAEALVPRYALYVDQREIPLDKLHVTLGRALDNDVILDHPTVSRRHARINLRHGRHVLRDLNSRNGTFVNGERVSECVLRDGDRLALGDVHLLFQSAGQTRTDRDQRTAGGPRPHDVLPDDSPSKLGEAPAPPIETNEAGAWQ